MTKLRTFYINVYDTCLPGSPCSSLEGADWQHARTSRDIDGVNRVGCLSITIDKMGKLIEAKNV